MRHDASFCTGHNLPATPHQPPHESPHHAACHTPPLKTSTRSCFRWWCVQCLHYRPLLMKTSNHMLVFSGGGLSIPPRPHHHPLPHHTTTPPHHHLPPTKTSTRVLIFIDSGLHTSLHYHTVSTFENKPVFIGGVYFYINVDYNLLINYYSVLKNPVTTS